MLPIKFSSILIIVYFVPSSSSIAEPYYDKNYSPEYYPDQSILYFHIGETVKFTNSLILDIMEKNYTTKLNSVLSAARGDELQDDVAFVEKGYVNTVMLLDDVPNSSNITIYNFTHTIDLLFNQLFLSQELYDANKTCDYIGRIGQNNTNNGELAQHLYHYNSDTLIFEGLEVYDPDEWTRDLNNVDKLYSMNSLPNHFDEFIQNKTEQALKEQKNNCEPEIPFNIKLLQWYQYLAQIERARFILDATVHQVKYACRQSNDTDILFDLKENLIHRTRRYMTTVKRAMKTAPREIRLCNLNENDNSKYIEAGGLYRMSLKEAVSNVEKNETITAIAFESRNYVIYPRIQTAILSSKGQVRPKRLLHKFDWEKLTNETQDNSSTVDSIYFGGGESQIKSINLDDIYVGDGYVVTGVKFVAISNTEEQNIDGSPAGLTLGLQVRATQFDFETGKLGESKWISSETPRARRTELKLGSLDDPFKLNENCPDSVDGQYVQFRNVSSGDGGITTVPFFDGHKRTIRFTFPLGGVGLYHNGAPGSGGYISFKLISYDPSIYMYENYSKSTMAQVVLA